MICPNCGKDCRNANFCSECGTSLKQKPQTEKVEKDYSTLSLIAFIVSVAIPGMNLLSLLTVNASIYGFYNGYRFFIPFIYIVGVIAFFDIATIVFASLYRGLKKKGFGIVALVCASILKVLHVFDFGSLICLASVITLYVTQKKK